MENSQSNIDINYVLEEYKNQIMNLSNENVMLMAYIKQLENEIRELKSK